VPQSLARQVLELPDNGFQLDIKCDPIEGTSQLDKGTYIDRFGGEGGFFASPAAAPHMQRSLPPSNLDWPQTTPVVPYNYHLYQVLRPFDVVSGPIAAWFEQPGHGVQYNLPFNISTLLCVRWLHSRGRHDQVPGPVGQEPLDLQAGGLSREPEVLWDRGFIAFYLGIGKDNVYGTMILPDIDAAWWLAEAGALSAQTVLANPQASHVLSKSASDLLFVPAAP
jgi:hypothetical protein